MSETDKAIFSPYPGFKIKTFDSTGLSVEGTLSLYALGTPTQETVSASRSI